MRRAGQFVRQLRDASTADQPQFVAKDKGGNPIVIGCRVGYATPRGFGTYEGEVMRWRADPRWSRDPRGRTDQRQGWLDVRRDDGHEASVRASSCWLVA